MMNKIQAKKIHKTDTNDRLKQEYLSFTTNEEKKSLQSYTKLGNRLLINDYPHEALVIFQSAVRHYSDKPSAYAGIARTYQKLEDWHAALKAWENTLASFPANMNAAIGLGVALLNLGKVADAKTQLTLAVKNWPDHHEPWAAMANFNAQINDYGNSLECWERAFDRDHHNLKMLISYSKSLLDNLEFDKAMELYTSLADTVDDAVFLSLLSKIQQSKWETENALKTNRLLLSRFPGNFSLSLQEVNYLMRIARSKGDSSYLFEAIALLNRLRQSNPRKNQVYFLLAEAYIFLGKNREAREVIQHIPSQSHSTKKYMELKAWLKNDQGDTDVAKDIWKDILNRHYVSTVHTLLLPLQRLDNNPLPDKEEQILLFSVMYNEYWRLKWFLDYYRKLGVSHFFLVDNDSNDGSREYLQQQKDVHLFWTRGNYAQSMSGMRWVNDLVEIHGNNQWCLYVDADEALVFPGIEDFNLHHLTSYMRVNKQEALFAFMLDMLPEHETETETESTIQEHTDFIKQYPYFNNNYQFHGKVECPYTQLTGGSRQVFSKPHMLNKTPLIRGGRGIRYLSSSHKITPAYISDVTAVLMHYKMAGDFTAHLASEIERKKRAAPCLQRHIKYMDVYKSLDKRELLNDRSTVRFHSSEQLIELGLIKSPKTYYNSLMDAKTRNESKQYSADKVLKPTPSTEKLQQQLIDTSDNAQKLVEQFNELVTNNQIDKALAGFNKLAKEHPESPLGLTGLAQIAQHQKKHFDALGMWDTLTSSFPNYKRGYMGKGKILLNMKRLDDAERVFEIIVEKWPKTQRAWQSLIRIAQLKKDDDLTRKFINQKLSYFPNDPASHLYLTRINMRQGLATREEMTALIDKIQRTHLIAKNLASPNQLPLV